MSDTVKLTFTAGGPAFGFLEDGEKRYVVVDELDFLDGEGFHAKGRFDAVNRCDHCGRFDTVLAVARSVEDMATRGWIVEEDRFYEARPDLKPKGRR